MLSGNLFRDLSFWTFLFCEQIIIPDFVIIIIIQKELLMLN